MCNLVVILERYLGQTGKSGIEQAKLLRMAGKCRGLRMLILLAYKDDAGDILREIRKELEKRVR